MSPVIKVEGVSKKFTRHPEKGLARGLGELLRFAVGKQRTQKLKGDEFWAVRDVSFELAPGQSLGLIGRNGSGKTTLLKMLNGILYPDEGKIEIFKKVNALINLGAGFDGNLTGKENIFKSASLLGLTNSETRSLVDIIIEFSELGEFIDSPVKTYSSGMKSRLGFSVASHTNPGLLLIDEVLAVGDEAFKNKCLMEMHAKKKEGVSMILVSHSPTVLTQFCDLGIWLDKGKVMGKGNIQEVLENYLNFIESTPAQDDHINLQDTLMDSGLFGPKYCEKDRVGSVGLKLPGSSDSNVLKVHDPLTLEIQIELEQPASNLSVAIQFWRRDGLLITAIQTINSAHFPKAAEGRVQFKISIPEVALNPGDYVIVMPILDGRSFLFRDIVGQFKVHRNKRLTWGLMDFNYELQMSAPSVFEEEPHAEPET